MLDGLRGRVEFDAPDEERVVASARIKAEHPMAFADAFAIVDVRRVQAVLLTGDPEIIDAPGQWEVEDLR